MIAVLLAGGQNPAGVVFQGTNPELAKELTGIVRHRIRKIYV